MPLRQTATSISRSWTTNKGNDAQRKGFGKTAEGGGGHLTLELEVDEGLDVGRFDLNDKEDDQHEEQGLDHQRTAGDEVLASASDALRHEVEHIAQQHEQTHGGIGGAPLQEDLGLELVENLMEHGTGHAEGGGTEEHPQGSDQMEGDESAHQYHKPVLGRMGIVLAGQIGQRAERLAECVPYLVKA